MIVWGGYNNGNDLNSGGRYHPAADTWTATTTINTPIARESHTAVWTGSEMIVWGGLGCGSNCRLNSGGRYNPNTDSWTATSTVNAPEARWAHTVEWTGGEMIVWGGTNQTLYLNTGAKYNPTDDSWTPTSTGNAPLGRVGHTTIWSGSEMIVWGGTDSTFNDTNTGGRYNPTADSWMATTLVNAPSARDSHVGVWTGTEMIVWGGEFCCPGIDFNTGGRYNASTDDWTATTTTNAPVARRLHTAVWTGSEMIAWGGYNDDSGEFLNTGGRYCAQSGPTPTPTPSATPAPPPTPTPTPVPTPTPTSTPTPTPTPTPQPTPSPSPTPTPTATPTPTPTPPIASPYDFNRDGRSDFVLYNASTRRTAIWYLHNNVYAGGAFGPTLPTGWNLIDVADFNRDGTNDYALFNSSTRQTAIWYMSGNMLIGGAWGLTLPIGWELVATGDFNGDSKPDFVIYKPSTGQSGVWFLNNNVYIGRLAGG
jgi:FG-GAP-like repeat